MNAPINNQKSPKPDFDFIVNQGSDPAPKKRNKRVIVLIVLLVVTFVLLVVGALLSSNENVQPETNQTLSAEEAASYQGVVTNFLELLKTGDGKKAYTLFEEGSVVTEQNFQDDNEEIWPKVQVTNCQYQRAFVAQGDVHLLYTCPYEQDEGVIEFVFRPSDPSKIKEYVFAVSSEATVDDE